MKFKNNKFKMKKYTDDIACILVIIVILYNSLMNINIKLNIGKTWNQL